MTKLSIFTKAELELFIEALGNVLSNPNKTSDDKKSAKDIIRKINLEIKSRESRESEFPDLLEDADFKAGYEDMKNLQNTEG